MNDLKRFYRIENISEMITNENKDNSCVSPKKWSSAVRQHNCHSVLVELSTNVSTNVSTNGINYEERDQTFVSRMRFTPIQNNTYYQKLVEENDDFRPKTINEFFRYLNVISVKDLKDKPFIRLKSRHPLRHLSRVPLKPKIAQKVAINSMDLSSVLRKTVLKEVESLKEKDIESKIIEYESYCSHKDVKSYINNKNDINIEGTQDKPIVGVKSDCINNKCCALLVPKLESCPECNDYVFNRSKKNAMRRRFHSCLKGRINNEISNSFKKICI